MCLVVVCGGAQKKGSLSGDAMSSSNIEMLLEYKCWVPGDSDSNISEIECVKWKAFER